MGNKYLDCVVSSLSLSLKVHCHEKNPALKFPLDYVSPQWTMSGVGLPVMIPQKTQFIYQSIPRQMPPSGYIL